MKIDSLKQFIALQSALRKEKAALEERLAEINAVLGASSAPATSRKAARAPARAASASPSKPGPKRGRKRRVRNAKPLKEIVRSVLAAKPLTRQETLKAVEKTGYKFSTNNPLNSLGTLLYNKKMFKLENGKFSLIKA